MPWPVEIREDRLVIWERQGGTRGTNYLYMLDPHKKKLIHISRLIRGALEGTSRLYRYEIPLAILGRFGTKITLFDFSYTNSGGGPYITKYVINSEGVVSEERADVTTLTDYEFEVLGPERTWIELYRKYVYRMVSVVKEITSKLGVDISFAGHAARLEDLYRDPGLGLINALVQPSWRSRQKALESYIRSAHELYVLSLIANSLNGRTIYHVLSDGKPYWWIEYASDYSTAVIETLTKKYTLWFQFSLKEWWDVVREGWAYAMFGKPITHLPTSRQHVRPDIVIMEGEYRYRSDLKERAPELVVLVDAKISFNEEDFRQLEGYVRNFGELFSKKITYIVACLELIPLHYKRGLERLGYRIVEEVAPDEKGEREFQDLIREVLKEVTTAL